MNKLLSVCAFSLLAAACTTVPKDQPGIEEQADSWHYDRNPAQLPTTSAATNPQLAEDPATTPVQIPDSQGTVRTPRYVDDVQR